MGISNPVAGSSVATLANVPHVYNVVEDYLAAGDGVSDDTSEIQAAIDAAYAAGGGIVFFPAKTYLCLSLALKANVHLLGERGATLVKNGGGVATTVVTGTGSTSTSIAATANIGAGDTVVTVASSTGIAAGDYVLVRDNTYKYGSSGQNLELNRVASVTATTITLVNRTLGSYATASTAAVVKLSAITNATVEGLAIQIPSGTSGGGVQITYGYNCVVRDCVISGAKEIGGVRFTTCAHSKALLNKVIDGQSTGTSALGYGLRADASSHHCIFGPGNHVSNMRECNVSDNARHCSFIDNTIIGNYDSGINTHGSGCEHILIRGNHITATRGTGVEVGFSGSQATDNDVQILGNVIVGSGAHGIYAIGKDSSNHGARVSIVDNDICDFGINAGGNNGVLLQNVDHVDVRGNRITAPAADSASVSGVNISTGTAYISVTANRIENLGTAGADGVALTGSATAPDRVTISGNQFYGVADQNVVVPANPTNIVVIGNVADDSSVSLNATACVVRNHNVWAATIDA